MPKKAAIPLIIVLGASVAACSNTAGRYQPIVDGPRDAQYAADVSSCQDLASERSYANGDVKTSALVGAGLGTLLGAVEEGGEGAIVGGLLGSAIGGGATAWEARSERKNIILECMRGRGHNVVG